MENVEAKKHIHKSQWKQKAIKESQKSLSLAKSFFKEKTTSFGRLIINSRKLQNFFLHRRKNTGLVKSDKKSNNTCRN